MSTAAPEGTIPPPPLPPSAPRRFVRREHGKWLAGVATGMSDALGIDVAVVRVLWVIVGLASFGVGVAAYALFWIAFPSERHRAPISRLGHRRDWSNGYVVGIVLLCIGALIVVGQLASLRPYHHFGALAWATILIGGGAAVLFLRNPDGHDDDAPPTPPGDTATSSAPFAADETGTTTGTTTDTTTTEPTPTFPLPPTPPFPPSAFPPPAVPPLPPTTSAWTQHAPWPAPPPKPPRVRRRRHRPFLTPLTISLLLIGAGIAALLDSAGSVHLTAAGVLASGLILVGAALVLSAWYGRAHGLIPIGLILLVATIPAVSIDVPISGGVGERVHHPVTRTEMRSNYELGIGRLEINLKDAPLSNRVTSISGSLGIGELEVDVPSDVRVDVHAHVGAGATDLFDSPFRDPQGGWPQNAHDVAGVHERGVLYLDLRVGVGVIRVHRWSPAGVPLPA